MVTVTTSLQWFSFLSLAILQKPFLSVVKDVLVYVCMSGALLFLVTIVLAYGLADKEMQQHLSKAAQVAVSRGVATKGNEVLVPFSYEAFVSASVTMSVVSALAVLLCCSFVLEMAWCGVVTCVAPMVALTVNTVKPKCWDIAEDYRGKAPPPVNATA
ncbi:conserved hypothetical protein [Leishmania braziliensis MHOM/BR/75/M2904]|uniref:Uncharacterized protein n=2 Tax=Leishmania braziliensis TaxID=5660 RepID=A4HAT5_LEIBR|nr:conserved hypothetical protein [Leishmania braziliensis MHOM/BR/75/M2904]KAI5686457.1 hypothetical protein MNV84_03071 [Leishmania braziliensis]CAJ2471375.1 unnamed protein product [Leishmania braziliensis]CAJ2471950.1 unnamed protein product [Leishmania braziliensis]CAM38519.1 conserved hypothetical protein [Leishmania braziliensis MHOM/BR/75/M2904]SYZ65216.1 hypothetical_protein [Leishmania braziliensis MHOM/BR/75/M2904]